LQGQISYAEGPINWYLSVKYDHDPTTGAVSLFPQKADDIVKELAEPVAIHDEKLVKEYQALVGSFL